MNKADFLICVLVLIVGCVLLVNPFLSQGTEVEITLDGNLFGRYSLHENKIIVVESEYGKNTVNIQNGSVYVTDSTCDDKSEIIKGSVNKSGQSLICLPNRLVITVVGREAVGSVSY